MRKLIDHACIALRLAATPLAIGCCIPSSASAEIQAPFAETTLHNVQWRLRVDNDSLALVDRGDRWYSSGIRITRSSRLGKTGPIQALHESICKGPWPCGTGYEQRGYVTVDHQIYTPSNTQIDYPPLWDQPWASELSLETGLTATSAKSHHLAGIRFELTGPQALGESVQRGVHTLFAQSQPKGWQWQTQNDSGFSGTTAHRWRTPITGRLDVITHFGGRWGNLHRNASLGFELRLGNQTSSLNRQLPNTWMITAGAQYIRTWRNALASGATQGYINRAIPRKSTHQIHLGIETQVDDVTWVSYQLIRMDAPFDDPIYPINLKQTIARIELVWGI